MKIHMTLLVMLAFFFSGRYCSIGQVVKEQPESTMKKKELIDNRNTDVNKGAMTPITIAKQQALHLQKLLKLDDDQAIKAHEICLNVENGISKISNDLDENKRLVEINNYEIIRSEKLKEILTADQFRTYQNYIQSER